MVWRVASDDIFALEQAFGANEEDARVLVSGLSEIQGTWRIQQGTWNVAECLDHLATANRVYLAAMQPPAQEALEGGRTRHRPALPGLIGGWFVRSLEPPVNRLFKMKAHQKIRPRLSPPLASAAEQFFASHSDIVAFLRNYSMIDLAGVAFPNPFIPGVRFSLATGLHVLAAHERRHFWQAWRVKRAAEQAGQAAD
jgi:hypothetical protein